MAQADWTFIQDGGLVWTGGIQGAAVLHNALSSPLAGEGDYCRAWQWNSGGLSGTSDVVLAYRGEPELTNIPADKALSVRSWVRIEKDIDGRAGWVGLVCRTTASTTRIDSVSGTGITLKYGSLSSGAATQLQVIYANAVLQNRVTDVITTLARNTWHKLRLDVIPAGASNDVVRVYTGTGATDSEVWTQIYERYISATDTFWVSRDDPSANLTGVYFGISNTGTSEKPQLLLDRTQFFLTAA